MNRFFARACTAALTTTAITSASAQGPSTEAGHATLWFGLLIVVFVLLIGIGLFLAQDRESKSRQASSSSRSTSKRGASQPPEDERQRGNNRGNRQGYS